MASLRPSLDAVKECMQQPHLIRNVCILAHVDHGKTTIADCLLATNHLVSKRMAGQIRYLDDRLDEQERGITMKISTVSLVNKVENDNMLLNIIDTPGHIDFSSEVGAALRVSDGALIVVDLVEGVCVQTREAIKQSFSERCKMILVLNKIDKLIVELRKDINDIFQYILRAIEDCNAIIAELYQYEFPESTIDIEDTGLLFSPETGNIIFSSAIDGWGFTTRQIARMFLGVVKNENEESLNKKLWNFDAYVDANGNIKYGAIEKNKINLFVQLCLKTIIYIYTTIIIQMEKDKIELITKKLNITKITRDMNHTDTKIQLRTIMQAWSPLADIILLQIKKIILPPNQLDNGKIDYLLDKRFCEDETKNQCIEYLTKKLKDCLPQEPTIVYISKMFCVNNKSLSQNKPKVFIPRAKGENANNAKENNKDTAKETEEKPPDGDRDFSIIALARVFHGTLKIGQEINVFHQNSTQKTTIKDLYILFGRELVQVDTVIAGNICGIGGMDSTIVRSATLSTTLDCIPFIEHPSSPPIVRNAIEPINPKDLPILRKGLRLLMQSDPCVQIIIQESGEHVLLTAGDVHLAKCLEDLTKIFAKIDVNVSDPMVSLRETILEPTSKYDYRKDMENIVTIETNEIILQVIAVSLPENIAKEFEKNYKLIRNLEEYQEISGFELLSKRYKQENCKPPMLKVFKNEGKNILIKKFKDQLEALFEANQMWSKVKNKIWSVSKMHDSINLLINDTNYKRNIFETLDESDLRSCFDNLIINAFNTCCKSGPICEEPLKNCGFIVKKFEVIDASANIKFNANIELAICNGFREAFCKKPQRLMEPIFTTSIQVNTTILGKVYSVLNRRYGKVLDAVGMDEQEKSFLVKAQIPVLESTGFANEMRKTTSGQAIPNLKFSHFEIIDGDPYFEPVEDDEEDEEINVEASIRAMKLRKDVRRRKGLHCEEQVVIHAEKQRTLKKK